MICRPPSLLSLRSGDLDIKDAQLAESKEGRNISYHIISRLGAMGVQKGYFGRSKIQFSSNVAKFERKIRIYMTLIFFLNDFSCEILSFGDIIDFVFFCRTWQKFGYQLHLHCKRQLPISQNHVTLFPCHATPKFRDGAVAHRVSPKLQSFQEKPDPSSQGLAATAKIMKEYEYSI